MSLVVNPSARERFTPRELIAAYEDFIKSKPQYLWTQRPATRPQHTCLAQECSSSARSPRHTW
jgi:hypothetical protein